MAKKFKPTTASRINESTDFSVKEIVRSKIIKYAQDRLNKSGAVLLAPVYDMINFNDPLDGMISFYYLDTIAENEELSEEESGYDYIEQAVTDIANFIQNQGFIMDEESDDPLVFIDENYDEEDDEELDDMNESVKWTETDEPNQWVNKLTKNKEAIDPITLECKDLGVALFASKLSEDADNNFYKVMIVNSDTDKSMTKSLPFDGIDLEYAISKLKKCDNKDDLYTTISKYLFLRKSDVSKLFGISMNESASITKTDNYDEFNLLPPGNKFMDPIKLENEELGIWATAGVMFDEDDPDNEDDYSAVVLVSPLDPKYENYVVSGDFGDNYSSAKNIMKKLAQIKTPEELAKIIKDKKFSDYYGIKSNTDFLVDMVRKLYSKMNESTMINEAASIKKSDRYREFNLLPKGKGWMDPVELTNKDAGFYAIAGTIYDKSDRDNEDEWGIVVILAPLDEDYEDVVITGSFYDYEEAADGIMSRLSRAKTPSDVARIIKNQDFYDDYDDDESEFLAALTKSYSAQNESTVMNEYVQVSKPKSKEALNHYLTPKGSTMISNDKLGYYVILGKQSDEDGNPDNTGFTTAYISTIGTSSKSIDNKKINEVLESTFEDSSKARSMIKEISKVEDLDKLAYVLRKYEFYNSNMDTTEGQKGFISLLEDKLDNVNESTIMINESAQIKPCNPALEGFDLLDSNNPFDFEPVDLENTELGFYAIAGVATGANPSSVWVEDDCSIEICITTLDPDYTDEVLVAEYYDVDYKAMNVMQELASATSYNKLTSILVKEGFQGMNSGPFDFVDDLEAINSMNEATEVPDGRMTVELDDTDVIEGDTLLLAELTDDVFNAVNTVLDELDPDADVEITIDNEDLLQLAVVSDEDLDDDAFDQVLSELLEDMDLEDIVADMTDSEPIEDPDDEDFGRVIQYINFYPATGATVVPDNSVMEDNVDVIEDEDVINESTAPDYSSLANKVKDCIATYYSDGVVQRASVEVNKNKDSVICVDLKFPNRDGIDAKEAKEISKLVLSKFDNLRTLDSKKEAVPQFNTRIDIKGDCLVYYVMPYNNARPGEAILARYNFVVTNSSMNESTDVSDDSRIWKSVDPIYESYYKDNEEDLSIDQDTINKALKAISRILTKAGRPLDNLEKVYRFNYPRPGLVQISLIPALKDTYGYIGNEAYDIDNKIEKKLESLNITYCSKFKSGIEIYLSNDKLVHYDRRDISKYINTGKVPDRQFSRDRVSAVRPKLEDIADSITKFVESHPKYKKFNLYKYPPVHVGADYIEIKVRTEDLQDGKDILADTNKYISKNYKELYARRTSAPDKKYPFIDYAQYITHRPGEGTLMWSNYEMRGSSVKGLMNESVDDDNSEAIGSYDFNESVEYYSREKDLISPKDREKIEQFAAKMEDALARYLRKARGLGPDDKIKETFSSKVSIQNGTKISITTSSDKKLPDKKVISSFASKAVGADSYIKGLPLDDIGATSRGVDWAIYQGKLMVSVYTGFKPLDPTNESSFSPKLPTQKELQAIIQKSLMKIGDRSTRVTVHAIDDGFVDIDLTNTPLATDGRDEDYYNEDDIRNSLEYAVKELINKFYQPRDLLDVMRVSYNKVGSLTITLELDSELNEATNYKKFADKLETYLNDDIDTIYDEMVVSVDETGYGYNINVTFDNRLLGSNPSKIISKIVNHIVERNGKYSDLVHYNNKVTGDYKLVFSYKGQLNECAIIGPDETDIDSLRANELSRALNSDQPLVDPYDIRCTIRPVFVRKDQFLFDGSTVYKATANASTDKDSGTTEIKVDVLLSDDPDITDASMTLTLPTEFDGLKLLRGNPTKVYNESADVKADTVTLSFANEDEANEFIKDNGVKPEKSFEGKFGWTVILKKSDLKKIK